MTDLIIETFTLVPHLVCESKLVCLCFSGPEAFVAFSCRKELSFSAEELVGKRRSEAFSLYRQKEAAHRLESLRTELRRCEREWANSPRENSIARDARADKRASLNRQIDEAAAEDASSWIEEEDQP